ncbi:hypothetical protein [Halomontanus rarus]|uniref:hypothetical protein n=1 Tax=Halomontanus rarus TaxID=3034020 RepID=UPI001A990886|nr:hypothetical protein [Halovivax sp. TS33]
MSGDLTEGMESSKGDPKVLLILNVVLSAIFAYIVLWLSAFAGITTFSWGQYATFTLLLIVLTFVVTRE